MSFYVSNLAENKSTMEKYIDIKRVVDKTGIKYLDLANELFPGHAYPRLALNRVTRRENYLNEKQISRLCLLTEMTVGELFGENEWKSKKEGDHFIFTSGDFRAELNTDTWVTKVYHKQNLFHDSVITSEFISLSEYIKQLNVLISNK